jgi:hypothetical protein
LIVDQDQPLDRVVVEGLGGVEPAAAWAWTIDPGADARRAAAIIAGSRGRIRISCWLERS